MPEPVKLTHREITKLTVPPGERDVFLFDSEVAGFGVRKFKSGKTYFLVKYSVNGKQRRQSLKAEVTDGNIDKMRKLASEVKARAAVLGQDLIAERKAARDKPASVPLGSVVPLYLAARQQKLRPRTYGEWKRYLESAWKPLHKRPLDAITRDDIIAALDEIEHESGSVSADRAKVALSGLFAWAMDDGYGKGKDGRRLRLSANPTLHVKNKAAATSRKRTLSGSELAEVWRACLDDDYGSIVRLLMLTGQRKSEIADLAWHDIDLDKAEIALPAERTKNARPHLVPLSREAVQILRKTPRREGRTLLFGSGSGGFSGWSKAKAELDARIAAARAERGERRPISDWVVHDIRRTVATGLRELRFADPHLVELVLNHVSGMRGGIAGVYDRSERLEERRRALQLWGEHVAARVSGQQGKVVPMKRRAEA